ncbi:MAG TPA: CAP domain-containing protein [Candidatus Saccharimonadales bacterium]|nr:CAP domain-containing protein [Candidatus Saccharimonadales bacterium]
MAKIKKHTSDSHKTRPKGITKQNFERVYWPYLPLVIIITLLLTAGSYGGGLANAFHHPFGRVLSYSTSMSVNSLLTDTNAARNAHGVPSLSLSHKLDAAAQAQADDMATRDYWSHDTPEGSPPWTWVTDQGYAYEKLGQNLAAGFSDEQSTVDGWMASAPHRENLLDSSFTQVGFGYANNANYTAAGGGPMTIVVAFYGEPQVLGASTTQPTSENGPTALAASTESTPPQSGAKSPSIEAASKSESKQPQPATTETPASEIAPPRTTSRIQIAAPGFSYGSAATEVSLILAIGLGVFWISRHALAFRKLVLQGERYAIGHPLTDLALVIIAGLLFILSQSAGLVQ